MSSYGRRSSDSSRRYADKSGRNPVVHGCGSDSSHYVAVSGKPFELANHLALEFVVLIVLENLREFRDSGLRV